MRTRARRLLGGSAALGLAVGGLLGQVTPASAESACLTSSSDFDRDGTPDVAVGIPGGAGRDGAVRVRLSNHGRPVSRTLTGAPGFGSAVTSLSSYVSEGDDALCSQLVVGSPDESLSTDKRRSGAVYVYAFDAGRFVVRGVFYPQAQGVGGTDQSGARFGAALTAQQRDGYEAEPQPARLYVGAPGFDVDGVRDAGRVTSFWIDDDEDPSAHDTRTIDYGDDVTPGLPSRGGRLGASLSVGGGLLAMGAPGHRARGVVGAGTVLVAPADPGPDDYLPQEFSQATRGVPGTPERGDRFGAAVHLIPEAGRFPRLLVGAPGEDLGRTADAGAVTTARISTNTGEPVGTVRAVDQDSRGQAGTAEAGDGFGSAVTSIWYANRPVFLVGSPGEDVGRARNAGMVQIVGNGVGWTQRTRGVPGRAETGDRMGASLGGSVASGALRPLVGVPGEDDATGAVLVGLPGVGSPVTYLKGTRAGNRYGFAVGS